MDRHQAVVRALGKSQHASLFVMAIVWIGD
jgi:hypothetical protein